MGGSIPSSAPPRKVADKDKGRETLTEIGARLRQAMSRGAAWERVVAVEVMRLADNWDEYRAEAGGVEIGPWLRENVGFHPFVWYQRRARAHEVGEKYGVGGCMTTVALAWWADAVTTDSNRKATAEKLREQWRDVGRAPLERDMVARTCEPYVTKRKSRMWGGDKLKAALARIARLEAQIREMGAEPVE